jgi:hypothetical protein
MQKSMSIAMISIDSLSNRDKSTFAPAFFFLGFFTLEGCSGEDSV